MRPPDPFRRAFSCPLDTLVKKSSISRDSHGGFRMSVKKVLYFSMLAWADDFAAEIRVNGFISLKLHFPVLIGCPPGP